MEDKETPNKIIETRTDCWFFYDNNLPVFIIDSYKTWYSARITSISETHISFYCFEGNKQGETIRRSFADIQSVNEWRNDKWLTN